MDFKKILLLFCLSVVSCFSQDNTKVVISQDGYNFYPVLSPDKKHVSYLHMIEEDIGAVGQIWIYDFVKNQRKKISELELYEYYDSYPSWLNNEQLIFSSSGGIYSINIFTNEEKELISTKDSTVSFFAPSPSPDGRFIAFWMQSINEKDVTHTIWLYDIKSEKIITFPEIYFSPETEVIWYAPQWMGNNKIVGLFFSPPDEGSQFELRVLDLRTKTHSIIVKDLFSSFFKVSAEKVFYTKVINKETCLFSYDLTQKKSNKVVANLNGVFDIHQDGKIIFTRKDTLFTMQNSTIKSLHIKGSNPQMKDNLVIYEKWSEDGESFNNIILTFKH